MKKKTTWFVEPIGNYTNGVIARHLIQDLGEVAQESIEVKDVGRVNAYEVENKVITQLKSDSNCKFNIYRRQGGGQIEKYYFPKKKSVIKKGFKAVG